MFAKVTRAALLSAVFGLTASVALAQNATAPAAPAAAKNDNPVVARVNGKEIHKIDVLAAFQQLPPQARDLPVQQVYPAVLEQLISAKLVADAGYAKKLQDTAEVKARLKSAEERFVQEAYLLNEVESKITDAEVRKRYDEWVKANPPADEVRARHILTEKKEEADAIIKQLNGGADFATLAGQQKVDKASAASGGDLGYFVAEEMVEPFAKAAFAMKPGEVTKAPVQTEFGWHVIKVEDKRKRQPPTFEQAAPQIRQAVGQEIAGTIVKGLRNGAKVETFDLDGKPATFTPPAAQAAPAAK